MRGKIIPYMQIQMGIHDLFTQGKTLDNETNSHIIIPPLTLWGMTHRVSQWRTLFIMIWEFEIGRAHVCTPVTG